MIFITFKSLHQLHIMGSRSEGAEHPRIVAVHRSFVASVELHSAKRFSDVLQPNFLTNGSNGSNGKSSIFLGPNLCWCFTSINCLLDIYIFWESSVGEQKASSLVRWSRGCAPFRTPCGNTPRRGEDLGGMTDWWWIATYEYITYIYICDVFFWWSCFTKGLSLYRRRSSRSGARRARCLHRGVGPGCTAEIL